MSQHDLTVDNAAGGVFRADLNNALRALASFNSGPIAPPTMVGGMPWLDTSTTPAILKFRNEANSAWLSMGSLQDLAGILTSISGMSSKAPLASPVFSGTPTTPTPTSGLSNLQIANTAFVAGAISTAITNLINASPTALDTLKELATALGNDPNFATTVTNALAGKAPLNGAGTSGTWPISITGSAASASSVTSLTTAQTLTATAGAAVGGVGTYAFLWGGVQNYTPGQVVSASSLYYSSAFSQAGPEYTAWRPTGSWRCMGYHQMLPAGEGMTYSVPTLFLRIA